jgi:fatty-acyl-CoA synthase
MVAKGQLVDRKFVYFRDQFVLQEDGYGQVVGRIKDMIIRGGENIFPKEIEQVLEQHSEILEAQVTRYLR